MTVPRPSLILLLLYLNNEDPIRGRARMHNLVFLACRCVPRLSEYLDRSYTFRPYSCGFFSDELEEDIKLLEKWNLVRIEHEVRLDEYTPEIECEQLAASPTYSLTDRGRDLVCRRIARVLPVALVLELERLKRRYGKAPLSDLLREVHAVGSLGACVHPQPV